MRAPTTVRAQIAPGLGDRLRAFLARALDPSKAMIEAAAMQRRMKELPFADLDAVTGGGRVLVLAPHPDDESLGCGGLIAEACARGQPPVVAVLTDGSMSHPRSLSHPAPRLKALREEEARAAVGILGVPPNRLCFLGYKDGSAPAAGAGLAEAAARLAGLVREHGIGTILTTWEHDPHCDHAAAHAIARAAGRLSGARVVAYPVWGWLLPARKRLPDRLIQGVRLDVSRHLPTKRRAVAAHASQVSGLIADDPTAFRLNEDVLAFHKRPFEVYLFVDGGFPRGLGAA